MYEMPLRCLVPTLNNYSRSISLHYYSVDLLNVFFFLISNSAWYKQINVLAHTNENAIDSSGAEPATYCQTAGMWPIALFFTYMCTKIIDLSENV